MSTYLEGDGLHLSENAKQVSEGAGQLSSMEESADEVNLPSTILLSSRQEVTTTSPDETIPAQIEKHNEQTPVTSTKPKRNAFSELMTPKPKQQKTMSTAITKQPKPSFTAGLLPYLTQPDTFPPGTIVRQTEHTVLIRDLYPKALVHLLLLPRDPQFYSLDPFEAFNPESQAHTDFLALMRSEARSAALLASAELSRLVSPYSKSCKDRIEALTSDTPPPTLPPARDFLSEIRTGVHAAPSMDTLHIHIISVDNHSTALKTKKHYNSFNTDFFIGLEDFPLMEGDVNMTLEEQESLIKGDMRCWRCTRNFGNKFKLLKEHLDEEYEEWKMV